jgi:hypothetical protein
VGVCVLLVWPEDVCAHTEECCSACVVRTASCVLRSTLAPSTLALLPVGQAGLSAGLVEAVVIVTPFEGGCHVCSMHVRMHDWVCVCVFVCVPLYVYCALCFVLCALCFVLCALCFVLCALCMGIP